MTEEEINNCETCSDYDFETIDDFTVEHYCSYDYNRNHSSAKVKIERLHPSPNWCPKRMTEEQINCRFCDGIGEEYFTKYCSYCWGTGIADPAAPECYRLWKQSLIIYGDNYGERKYIKYLKGFPRKYLRKYRKRKRIENKKWRKQQRKNKQAFAKIKELWGKKE